MGSKRGGHAGEQCDQIRTNRDDLTNKFNAFFSTRMSFSVIKPASQSATRVIRTAGSQG